MTPVSGQFLVKPGPAEGEGLGVLHFLEIIELLRKRF